MRLRSYNEAIFVNITAVERSGSRKRSIDPSPAVTVDPSWIHLGTQQRSREVRRGAPGTGLRTRYSIMP
jgi:hypothetical protein